MLGAGFILTSHACTLARGFNKMKKPPLTILVAALVLVLAGSILPSSADQVSSLSADDILMGRSCHASLQQPMLDSRFCRKQESSVLLGNTVMTWAVSMRFMGTWMGESTRVEAHHAPPGLLFKMTRAAAPMM